MAALDRQGLRPDRPALPQVLVAGSEVTQDYRMQLYTPPYLTGSPNRPVIQSVMTTTPAYGADLTISLGWTNGTGSVSRAVLLRQGGVSNSLHIDSRQVRSRACTCLHLHAACMGGC